MSPINKLIQIVEELVNSLNTPEEEKWHRTNITIPGWEGKAFTRLVKMNDIYLPPGVKEIHMHKTTNPKMMGTIWVKVIFSNGKFLRSIVEVEDHSKITEKINEIYEEGKRIGYV